MDVSEIETLRTLAMAAAELVDDLGDLAERDRKTYTAGYRDGQRDAHRSGWDIGYAHAHHEMTERWAWMAKRVRASTNDPTYAERYAPGGPAYYAALVRHGGTEFAGVGKPRVPAPAGAYETALKRQGKRAA